MTPLELYGEDLLSVAAGGSVSTLLRADDGTALDLDLSRWTAPAEGADRELLARCGRPTLDLGCGPGRLVRALTDQGVPCLGIDLAPQAVALARRQGAPVLHASAFDEVLDGARFATVLLADGNIGIGGDPVALLRRCRDLLAPRGAVLAELDGPASPTRTLWGRLESGSRASSRFAWSRVSVGDADRLARDAGLVLADAWCQEDRWFVQLDRA